MIPARRTAPGLLFCDVSSFYGPTGGGIRTYHDAKIEWFASQQRHRYLLVHPGPRSTVTRPARLVTRVTVYGVPVRGGYRIPVDIARLHAIVRRMKPDVLETGDPWFSGPFGLLFKRWRHAALVSSFFHGDPMQTYVAPWSARGGAIARHLGTRADRYFFDVQRLYDLTLTSSPRVETMLRRRGVSRILRLSFGVDPMFLSVGRTRAPRPLRTRLLYAGRLQNDKGIDMLLEALPELLTIPGVELTIVGTGPEADRVARFKSPRVRMLGFVSSRDELARIYGDHDVLLAPGPYETFGLAALEGLAAGLSVVGPNAGETFALLSRLDRPHLFIRGDAGDFIRTVRGAIAADGAAEARAGVAVAEGYGSWRHAISAQTEAYCTYLSRSTT